MAYHQHHTPHGEIRPGASPEEIRVDFARRLQNALNEKGWTQSELARRIAEILPDHRVRRDSVSRYVRGKVLPLPETLDAICEVLGKESRDLLPVGRGTGEAVAAEPLWAITWNPTLTGGWIKINMWLPEHVLSQIEEILLRSGTAGATQGTSQ